MVHIKFWLMRMMVIYWVEAKKKNKEALLVGSKESGLEVNADKIKYMIMSRDQNAGRCH